MSALPDVKTSNFTEEVLNSSKPVLVDFWADWCGPCKMLAPVVEKLAMQFASSANFVKLNTDQNPEVAGKYGISGIPCLILFKDGKEIDRFVGFDPGPRITAMLNKHVSAS
jgi:thioredoxin 1